MNPLHRVLRGGRLPYDLRAVLDAEGLELLEERLGGSITYRHYRAPRERSNWSKEATTGAIAISTRRLVVWLGRSKHIDLTHDHPLRWALEVTAEKPNRLCFAYDAERFRNDRSGRVEVRLRTTRAERAIELLATGR